MSAVGGNVTAYGGATPNSHTGGVNVPEHERIVLAIARGESRAGHGEGAVSVRGSELAQDVNIAVVVRRETGDRVDRLPIERHACGVA